MSELTPCWVVIPATGIGQRMDADRPKQYLKLGSRTILELTLDNLLAHPAVIGAVLILNGNDGYWDELNYQHTKPVLSAIGGDQRHYSVFNGLNTLESHTQDNPIVLIHDAVRPFVLHKDIDCLIEVVQLHDDGALLAAPVSDTLKFADGRQRVDHTTPRDHLWRAFTPQAFRLDLIKRALDFVISNNLEVTDDASAMEVIGYHPYLVEGDSLNIKITHPSDLNIAKLLIKRQQ